MEHFEFSYYLSNISQSAQANTSRPTLKRILLKRLHVQTLCNQFEPPNAPPFVRENDSVTLGEAEFLPAVLVRQKEFPKSQTPRKV